MRHVFEFLVLLTSTGAAVIQAPFDDAPVCRPSTRCRTKKELIGRTSYRFEVNGQELRVIVDFQDDSFSLWCNSNSREALLLSDDSEMPTMPQLVTVEKAVFNHCVVPQTTYYDALKALNVTVSKTLRLQLPAESKLEVRHLRDLPITELEIYAISPSNPPRATFDFLDKLPQLRSLKLSDIVLEPEALNRLPTSLEILNVIHARLPTADHELSKASNRTTHWIERLQSLRSLHLVESSKFVRDNPRVVLTLPQLAMLPNLINASFYHMPLDENGLSIWLNGSSIKQLILKSCGLTTLPRSMFQDLNLSKIILSNNKLEKLEHGLFTPLRNSLIELDLSNNNLRALASAVDQLIHLETLKANNNPLGSLCGGIEPFKTPLESFLPMSLLRLELRGTEATRICTDWIRNKLAHIDLSNNNITELEYSDLEMQRMSNWIGLSNAKGTVTLNLTQNKLRKIAVSRQHYTMCIKQASSTKPNEPAMMRVPVKLEVSSLPCDCDAYWLRETLRDCRLLQINNDVACVPTQLKTTKPKHATLLEYGPDEIPCPYSGLCMPGTECSCEKRLRDNATVVRCKSAPTLPQWPPTALEYPLVLHVAPGTLDKVPNITLVELYAPNNDITSLDGIPTTLHKLDVSNNRISRISLATARAFKENNSQMNISGNLLTCDCADEPAFGFLKHVVLDWNSVQCKDHTLVSEKTERGLCSSRLLPLLFGIGVPLLLMVIVVLVLQLMLPRVKQFLFRHDLCHRWIDSANDDIDDPNKTHDVFLSYSYADLAQLKELKAGLEKLGYSTIEHENDWGPGEYVLDQITNSVLKARRTLLLVSDNYAKSQWTEEEFRAAHTHALECKTARVLIIRCGLHNQKALPKDLQHYLYNNTYLDWNDRKFWVKLWRVMPLPSQESLLGPHELIPPSLLPTQDDEKINPLLQILLEPQSNINK